MESRRGTPHHFRRQCRSRDIPLLSGGVAEGRGGRPATAVRPPPTSSATPFRLQIYNTKPRLSRVLGNYFLVGSQEDAESALTNRGRIVNFWNGISQVFSPAAKCCVMLKAC